MVLTEAKNVMGLQLEGQKVFVAHVEFETSNGGEWSWL
jgi:hypothetical protein